MIILKNIIRGGLDIFRSQNIKDSKNARKKSAAGARKLMSNQLK